MYVCPKCGKQFSGPERFCSKDGTALVQEMVRPQEAHPLVGKHLAGRYRITRKLGEGGMGAVFLADQDIVGREVAVKILRADLCAQVGTVRRFLREALACSKLDHPNIVSVYDFGRDRDGSYFIVMELVEGVALIDVIGKAGRLQQARAIRILDQVLAAAASAHREGIVHRDLKPENVFCVAGRRDPDHVKVLDFGLAKIVGEDRKSGRLTQEGFVVGTPEFMSPEQAWGRAVDHRSDLYSIGVIAYEMLTGVLPFSGPAPEVARLHITVRPRPPSQACPAAEIHPDLEGLVLTLLEKSPDERFQSAGAARKALATVAARIAEGPGEGAGVLERTRAALRPRTLVAMEALRSAAEAPGREAPTVYVGGRAGLTSPWEASELLDEIGRLARLWSRRVIEAVDLLWGSADRPEEVVAALDRAAGGEARIVDLETEIALARDRVSELDAEARRRDAELRFQRLDLVAQRGQIEADTAPAPPPPGSVEEDEGFIEGDTVPSAAIEAQAPVEDPRRGALQVEIDEIDEQSAASALAFSRTIAEQEREIAARVEEVKGIREELVPVYSRLAGLVKRQASGRQDLVGHVKALAEVVGAIQVYQAMLGGGGGR